MAVFLAIALVVSNACWLLFLYLLLRDNRRERWEYQERIRNPEAPKPPPVLSEAEKDQIKLFKRFTETHEDEFDLVGQIDPSVPPRENE